jgi:hypothetical protein
VKNPVEYPTTRQLQIPEETWNKPVLPMSECTISRPLMLYIPPSGINVPCPIHGNHFLKGTQITC